VLGLAHTDAQRVTTSAGDRSLREALQAFALASVLVALLGVIGRAVPWIGKNLGAFVAVVFLYVPVLWLRRRGEHLEDYGLHTAPRGRGLAIAAAFVAIVFPLFAVGFVVFYGVVCDAEAPHALRALAVPGSCPRFQGWDGLHLPRLGWDFVELAFVQLVVIALPEELFFRGYLLALLERRWPPARRLLGGGVGRALVVSSALFALGHLLVTFDLRRLAVFFPGLLFGWMRSATGSILAGVLAHAASNLFIHLLERAFL
jgi:membrane protease YdiL (CAAX protease family)